MKERSNYIFIKETFATMTFTVVRSPEYSVEPSATTDIVKVLIKITDPSSETMNQLKESNEVSIPNNEYDVRKYSNDDAVKTIKRISFLKMDDDKKCLTIKRLQELLSHDNDNTYIAILEDYTEDEASLYYELN